MPTTQPRSRRWSITVFIPEEEKEPQANWKELLASLTSFHPEKLECLAAQLERCPKTGKLHIQAALVWKTRLQLNTLKSKVLRNESAHCEISKASLRANYDYCTKTETRVEGTEPLILGDWTTKQGKRSDLVRAADDAVQGITVDELYQRHGGTYVRYQKHLKELQQDLYVPAPNSDKQVIVYWGVPGAGKTYRVYQKHGRENVYSVEKSNSGNGRAWFDGYVKQEVLIFDDFTGENQFSLDFMLKILDKQPFHGEVKGGRVWVNPTHIYLTSNVPWETWYDFGGIHRRQKHAFQRRLTLDVHFPTTHTLCTHTAPLRGTMQPDGSIRYEDGNLSSDDEIVLDASV